MRITSTQPKKFHTVRPSSILYNIGRKGPLIPSQSQLQTMLKKIRSEKFGQDKLHLGTLQRWLEENSVAPVDDCEPYIADYEVLINEKKPNESKFRFFVSTKKLLQGAINVEKIHTDATYKLIWQGFPVLLVGTTDMHRQFHMFGILVSTNEKEADIVFMFNALKSPLFIY